MRNKNQLFLRRVHLREDIKTGFIMRTRFLLIAAVLFCPIYGNAQKLEFKKTLDNGYVIKTTAERITTQWQPTIHYSLLFERSNDETNKSLLNDYSLIISVESTKNNLHFEKGSRLLLKTSSGDIIQLENAIDDSDIYVYDQEGYSSTISRRVWIKDETYLYSLKFPISEIGLDSIITNGIATLRIQTSANNIECVYPQDKIEKTKSLFLRMKEIIITSLDPSIGF